MAIETLEETASPRTGDAVIAELILAYDRALTSARASSRLVEVRTRVPRREWVDRLWRIWWLRWPVEHSSPGT